MRRMFCGEGCHRGVTMGGWGVTVGGWEVTVGDWGVTVGGWGVTVRGWFVTVGDWGVTVRVVVTVVDITVGEIGVTGGTMVVTVEGWFITVIRAWWGGYAEQCGQIQPPTSSRENMDLRVGPGCPKQVDWTHLLQRLHWTEIRPTSREQTEQGYMGFVGRTGTGPGFGWTLPLASRRRKIRSGGE